MFDVLVAFSLMTSKTALNVGSLVDQLHMKWRVINYKRSQNCKKYKMKTENAHHPLHSSPPRHTHTLKSENMKLMSIPVQNL